MSSHARFRDRQCEFSGGRLSLAVLEDFNQSPSRKYLFNSLRVNLWLLLAQDWPPPGPVSIPALSLNDGSWCQSKVWAFLGRQHQGLSTGPADTCRALQLRADLSLPFQHFILWVLLPCTPWKLSGRKGASVTLPGSELPTPDQSRPLALEKLEKSLLKAKNSSPQISIILPLEERRRVECWGRICSTFFWRAQRGLQNTGHITPHSLEEP